MLSTEHLGVEVPIPLGWDSLRVRLAANLDALLIYERNMFGDERVIEGVEVERGEGHRHGVRAGEGGGHR